MPGPWKAWKTKDGFPTLSTVPWKSRRNREIPTFPPPGFAAMGKWKTARPAKAGVLSGRQSHRGNGQKPRSLDSRKEGN